MKRDHEKEAAQLIDSAKRLIGKAGDKRVIHCSYFGWEFGGQFEIDKEELEVRIRSAIYEGFNIELGLNDKQLVVCQWEYPGPKPEPQYFLNKSDIPNLVQDLEGIYGV